MARKALTGEALTYALERRNLQVSLQDLQIELQSQFNLSVSISTLSRVLRSALSALPEKNDKIRKALRDDAEKEINRDLDLLNEARDFLAKVMRGEIEEVMSNKLGRTYKRPASIKDRMGAAVAMKEMIKTRADLVSAGKLYDPDDARRQELDEKLSLLDAITENAKTMFGPFARTRSERVIDVEVVGADGGGGKGAGGDRAKPERDGASPDEEGG